MKKILLLILVCVCFYMPTVSAELYQNRDYNFQMDIPDGWNNFGDKDEYILKRKIGNNIGGKITMGNFGLKAELNKYFPNGTTLENISKEQERDLSDTLKGIIQEKYPTSKVTYSDYVHINNIRFLMIKSKFQDKPYKLTYLLGILNKVDYNFIFVAYNDSGQYEQQFFDMLKTLRPIVGNNDADEWQEDVKYMRDVAEKEAIGAITNQKVTVKVK